MDNTQQIGEGQAAGVPARSTPTTR